MAIAFDKVNLGHEQEPSRRRGAVVSTAAAVSGAKIFACGQSWWQHVGGATLTVRAAG
jgi:hypothetical protein